MKREREKWLKSKRGHEQKGTKNCALKGIQKQCIYYGLQKRLPISEGQHLHPEYIFTKSQKSILVGDGGG